MPGAAPAITKAAWLRLRRAAELGTALGAGPASTSPRALGRAGEPRRPKPALRRHGRRFPATMPSPLRELHVCCTRSRAARRMRSRRSRRRSRASRDDVELLLGHGQPAVAHAPTRCRRGSLSRVLELDPRQCAGSPRARGLFRPHQPHRRACPALVAAGGRRAASAPMRSNFIRAFDHRRAKRFAEGLAALEQVPEDLETARRAASARASCSKGSGDMTRPLPPSRK